VEGLKEFVEQRERLKSEHQTLIFQEPRVQGSSSGIILVATDRDTGEIEGELVLEGDINTFSEPKRIAMEMWLKDHGGSTIRITDVQAGSIKIKIQGSQKDIAKLFDYLNSGDVSPIEGFSIQDTSILSSEFLVDLEAVESVEEPLDVKEISTQESAEVKIRIRDLRELKQIRANLGGSSLGGLNLSGADLSRANLIRAYLSSVNLSGADLSRAILIRADLGGSNLSGANLGGANLGGAILGGANLSEADLWGATLYETDLYEADLCEANLIRADLSRANLIGANLSGANLSEADLSRANLSGANLSGANLSEADLSRANLSRTDLMGVDLSNVENLNGAVFGQNSGLTDSDKADMRKRGAIFQDDPSSDVRTFVRF
jgi:uncharacterized protein YjbI with pentapeptide repeats